MSTFPEIEKPHLIPEESMSEAGRKILAYYLGQMIKHEGGVREGATKDAIHDMRVATRRLRSVLQIFAPFYRKGRIRTYRKILREVAEALGNVRDVEVLLEKTHKYADTKKREAPTALIVAWEKVYHDAYQELLSLLDTESYIAFLEDFRTFVTTPEQDAVQIDLNATAPYQVRHVAPCLIYEQYTIVRAFEPILVRADLDTLHKLRIQVKRLRYILESFESVLGEEAETVIEATKTLQDHLGDLQDARVASNRMQEYIAQATEEEPLHPILQYMATREEEKQHLQDGVRQAWNVFTLPEVRQALSAAVAIL